MKNPVPCATFISDTPKDFAKNVASRFKKGGLLTSAQFEHVIRILLELAPETNDILARYSEKFKTLLDNITPAAQFNLGIQKEALLTALLVSGQDFDRKIVSNWYPAENQNSFLDGLEVQRLDESQMIMNDFYNLPGFSVMSGHIKSTATFYSPSEVLTVIHADKEPLEKLTGADLIYYKETYKSFVFVQYKVLDNGIYRPDDQLNIEIRNMDHLLTHLNVSQVYQCEDFRLHNNPFFLKLCPRIYLVPENSSLTKGMYIPLEYWKILESSGKLLGPRGGQFVSFDNIGRYLTNTDFAALVSKAWIGSNSEQSVLLALMIKETLRAGRAALYAFKKPIKHEKTKCSN